MNDNPLQPIPDDARATYERDGAVCIRGQFGAEWIDRMREACERDMAAGKGRARDIPNDDGSARFYSKVYMNQEDADFRDFVLNSPAPRVAAELMGLDEVRFFYDQVFIEAGFRNNLRGIHLTIDESFDDVIEHFIRRQEILVRLVGTQLRRGSFAD